MKNNYKFVIAVFLIVAILIGLTSSLTGVLSHVLKTTKNDEKEALQANLRVQSDDPKLNNRTIEEWEFYEQELLEELHNDTWRYTEWRRFQIRLGYEMGQLNDEIMLQDYMLHNIHIITIIKWGRFNGSLNKEEEEMLKEQIIYETTAAEFNVEEANDEKIILSGRVGVAGPEGVIDVSYYIRSKIANPDDSYWDWFSYGKWFDDSLIGEFYIYYEQVYHASVIWVDNWLTPYMDWHDVATVTIPSGVIEDGIDMALSYTVFLLGLHDEFWEEIHDVSLSDDDTHGPQVRAFLQDIDNPGWSRPIYHRERVGLNISYSRLSRYQILIQASDPEGLDYMKGFEQPFPMANEWYEYTDVIINLGALNKSLHDYLNITYWDTYTIAGWVTDDDDDRPPWGQSLTPDATGYFYDHSQSYFEFTLDKSKSFPELQYYGVSNARIIRRQEISGIYLETASGKRTICTQTYKFNHAKNKVVLNFNFTNEEEYPIMLRFGLLVRDIHNINFEVNTEELFKLDYYNFYRSNAYSGEIPPYMLFQSHEEITYDGKYYFWIHIANKSTKSIDLFTISVNDLALLDPAAILDQDLKDLFEVGYDIFAGLIFTAWSPSSKLGSIFKYGTKAAVDFVGDAVIDFNAWQMLKRQYPELATEEGAYVDFDLQIFDAYVAHQTYDPNYEWAWTLNLYDDKYHYVQWNESNTQDQLYLKNMLKVDNSTGSWINFTGSEGTLGFQGHCYSTIFGFVPDEIQREAFQEYIDLERSIDKVYLMANLYMNFEMEPDIVPQGWAGNAGTKLIMSGMLIAIAALMDFAFKPEILAIVNGVDPPDYEFSEKPNAERIDFPYEDFPEFQEGTHPFFEKGKESIEMILDLERCFKNAEIANDRYVTAFDSEQFEYTVDQADYYNEYMQNISQLSHSINNKMGSFINEMEERTRTDFNFNDEVMEVLSNPDNTFEFDPRIENFIADIYELRDIPGSYEVKMEGIEERINSINEDDKDALNYNTPVFNNIFPGINEISNNLIKENMKSKVYVETEKLGMEPVLSSEDEQKLDEINDNLLYVRQLIESESYLDAITNANDLMNVSMNLYDETLHEEFLVLYEAAECLKLYAIQRNQLDITLIDDHIMTVPNGHRFNTTFSVRNILNYAMQDNLNYTEPVFEIPDLPFGMSYKIYEQGKELEKNPDGNYYLTLNQSQVKTIKLELAIEENSPLELQSIPLNLEISQTTSEKSMKSRVSIEVIIIEDDDTAPELSLVHIGEYTDGDSGSIEFEIDDPDFGSDATAKLSLINSAGITFYSEYFMEGNHSIVLNDLFILSPGEYTILLEGENNDEDGPDDEEFSTVSITLTIVDDDETAPMIYINYLGGGEDSSPGFFEWTIIDYDEGFGGDYDTGFSILDITVTYESTEGLPDKEYILPSIESGTWYLEPYLGKYTLIIMAQDNDDDRTLIIDALSTTLFKEQEIIDDDTIYPEISNLIIEDQLEDLVISFDILEDTGVGEIIVYIDGIEVIHEFPSLSERSFQFIIPNDWVNELGCHDVHIMVWDADNDRSSDSLCVEIWGTFEILFEELKQSIIINIDQLIEFIQDSSDDIWRKKNRKTTMVYKLQNLRDLVSLDNFEEAYNKLLHDIKPKLTGLKTDENENPWGNGVFKNPWVTSPELQEILRLSCNEILTDITTLTESTSSIETPEVNSDMMKPSFLFQIRGNSFCTILLLLGMISMVSATLFFKRKSNI